MPAQPTPLRPAPDHRPRTLRRVQPIERAARLIAEEKVTLDSSAKVYTVVGDHDVYRVIATEEGIFCPCPARSALCAHALAVAITRQAGKASPERLARDLGVAS
jgi:SWIM zinc finger